MACPAIVNRRQRQASPASQVPPGVQSTVAGAGCRRGFSASGQDIVNRPRAIIIPFRYLLNDIWFASAENMCHIKRKLDQEFTKKNLAVLGGLSRPFADQQRLRNTSTLVVDQ